MRYLLHPRGELRCIRMAEIACKHDLLFHGHFPLKYRAITGGTLGLRRARPGSRGFTTQQSKKANCITVTKHIITSILCFCCQLGNDSTSTFRVTSNPIIYQSCGGADYCHDVDTVCSKQLTTGFPKYLVSRIVFLLVNRIIAADMARDSSDFAQDSKRAYQRTLKTGPALHSLSILYLRYHSVVDCFLAYTSAISANMIVKILVQHYINDRFQLCSCTCWRAEANYSSWNVY